MTKQNKKAIKVFIGLEFSAIMIGALVFSPLIRNYDWSKIKADLIQSLHIAISCCIMSWIIYYAFSVLHDIGKE